MSEESERKVNEIFYAIERAGFPSYPLRLAARPHISLALYSDYDLDALEKKVKEFTASHSSVKLKLSGIGTFPGDSAVVFLIPTVSEKLVDLHSEFHTEFDREGGHYSNHYQPEYWVPHCTVAFDVDRDEVFKIMDICRKFKFPIDITLDQIGVACFKPSENLFCYKFKD